MISKFVLVLLQKLSYWPRRFAASSIADEAQHFVLAQNAGSAWIPFAFHAINSFDRFNSSAWSFCKPSVDFFCYRVQRLLAVLVW